MSGIMLLSGNAWFGRGSACHPVTDANVKFLVWKTKMAVRLVRVCRQWQYSGQPLRLMVLNWKVTTNYQNKIVQGRPLGSRGEETIIDTDWARSKLQIGSQPNICRSKFLRLLIYEPAIGARVPARYNARAACRRNKCTSLLVVAVRATPEVVAEIFYKKFPDHRSCLNQRRPVVPVHCQTFFNVVMKLLRLRLIFYNVVFNDRHETRALKSLECQNQDCLDNCQEALLKFFFGVVLGSFINPGLVLYRDANDNYASPNRMEATASTLLLGLILACLEHPFCPRLQRLDG